MKLKLSRRSAFVRIVRLEAHFFCRYPRLLLAALTVVLIPAAYVLIYLTSVWDPAAKTGSLPVALVNLDIGLEYRQQPFNVGRDLVERIKRKPAFGYQEFSDEALARRMVEEGHLAFALIVPADFSSNAIPGSEAGAGKLVVFTSEGNNYTSSGLARRFAEDLGREVNQSLNEQRWTLVLAESTGSQRSLSNLQDGLSKLREGAKNLASGAEQAADGAEDFAIGTVSLDKGVDALVGGTKTLSSGLRALYAQRPRNADLKKLDEGAKALVEGHQEFAGGLDRMQIGVDGLQTGITGFKAQSTESSFVPQQVHLALDRLGAGVAELDTGTRELTQGQRKLSDGSVQLAGGVNNLTEGARGMKSALREIVTKLPADDRLKELTQGSDKLQISARELRTGTRALAEGAQHISGGLDLLNNALPKSPSQIEGNAQGLSNSVRPVVEVVASVQNNGSGFAPNIIPGALWLGASMVAFLFHLRKLPRSASQVSAWTKMGAKIVLPMALVMAQALMVWICLLSVLEMRVFDHVGLASTLGLAAGTFLMVIYAMTRALGDVGKALALILLAVQLSSSGGILPVELSGGIFAAISDYLPITWVVKALKASLFGAFEGQWLLALDRIMVVAVLSAASAVLIGRWRLVRPSGLRPALDL